MTHRITVIKMQCPYTRSAAIEAFQNSHCDTWRVVTTADQQASVQWDDYEEIDWRKVLSGDLVASAYCHRKGLIRKAQLCINATRWISKHPDSILSKGLPESYPLELYHPDDLDEALICDIPEVRQMKEGEETWILKPSLCNQGAGISLFSDVATLRDTIELEENEDVKEWVVQRYIPQPFLIDGRKFHLRAYVLAVGSLQVYLYSDVLALFSLYHYPGPLDLSNLAAHLTNTCFQKSASLLPEEQKEFDENRAVRSLQELALDLGGQPVVDHILHQIGELTGEIFEAAADGVGFMPLTNCFELFGLDFLLTRNTEGSFERVYLLEINAEPDFLQTGSRLRSIVSDLHKDATDIILDRFFSEASGKKYSEGRGKFRSCRNRKTEAYKHSKPSISFSE